MGSRFLRENSQIIASLFVSGYAGSFVMYKINSASLWRSKYEMKGRNNITVMLSILEEEYVKKFLFRLKHIDGQFLFFRTNSLDFVSFGFNKMRQGADIGLPASYFANNLKELLEVSSPYGYDNFMNQKIQFSDLKTKLDSKKLNEFYNTLLLSNDAKSFGLANAIVQTNHFLTSCLENFIDFACLSAAYAYSYAKSRKHKLNFRQRRRLFIYSGVICLVSMVAARLFTKPYNDKTNDKRACEFGLDCCEGSLEYYDKLINRNKILRDVIENGHFLIDSDGNYLKQIIRIPFTDQCFYINNFGIKLTERRENCQRELTSLVYKLMKEKESSEKKEEMLKQETTSTNGTETNEEDDSKEWKIFRELRLQLESIKHEKKAKSN